MTKVYLAGPMSGIEHHNFPAFDEAAAELRGRGYEVISPPELDSQKSRDAARDSHGVTDVYEFLADETWGQMLARDIQIIADDGIGAVVVLPGWRRSRGARLETFVARLCDIPIVEYGGSPFLAGVDSYDLDDAHGTSGLAPGCCPDVQDPGPQRYESDNVISVDFMRDCMTSEAPGYATGGCVDTPMPGPSPLISGCWGPPAFDSRVKWDPINGYGSLATAEKLFFDGGRQVMDVCGEERVTNETTGGEKGRKPQRMELLPYDVLMRDVAPLYAAGALKYDDNNWRRGYDWSLSFGALMRHASQFWSGEDQDSETGCSHMASVVFHALALLLFAHEHPGLDDRP